MLSDILSLFRLKAEVYHNAKVCGNWEIREHQLGQTCFHMPVEGACKLSIDGHVEEQLDAGDLIIFPRELPHQMCPISPLEGEQIHLPYPESKDREGTGLICGRIEFKHNGCHLLLRSLPEFLILRKNETESWLAPLLTLIKEESYRADETSHLVLDRLSEMLFVYALRTFIEKEPDQTGVLALYSNPMLAGAIKAMHSHPEQDWTLESLASAAMMSRTKFANMFRNTGKWTPMQYLTWWRMQLAWDLLTKGEPIADVSERVGYKSESAFSRVFKKEFGTSVGAVRRGKIGQENPTLTT